MSFSLMIAPLPLVAIAEEIAINLSDFEIDLLNENPDTHYVYINKNFSNISAIVNQLCALDKDKDSLLHQLKKHIAQGFSIAEYDAVVEALEHAESVLEKNYDSLNKVRAEKIRSDLDEIIENVILDESQIKARHLHHSLVIDKNLDVKGKSLFHKHVRTKQGITTSGHLKVGKSATFRDNVVVEGNLDTHHLSADHANIENLTLSGGLSFTDLSVEDATINGTLSVNDLVVNNCIDDLCVTTLSVNDAVIQNLTLSNALSFNDL